MNLSPIYKSPAGEQKIMARYDAVLARWPVPHEVMNLPTRHGRTCVVASGDAAAPPLILLHGSSSNAMAWVGDVSAYSSHFRACAVDIPGEPGRSEPVRPTWDGPAFAEWLSDVLDGLGAPKASLLGISQGGWTALKFTTSHPERVDKLVLLAPGGIAPPRPSFMLRVIPLSLMGRPGAEAINRIVFGRQPIHPEAVAFMNVIMTHFKPRIEPQALYSDAALTRLTMPVLLIVGQQDALLPAKRIAERMRGLVPHLTAVLIPDMGHVLHNTADQVMPFLLADRERT